MIHTQIHLSGTGIYSGFTSIDLFKDEPIDIVYSVADVRNISNRDSTFSKQIVIPATTLNNRLFNHIFEIGSDSSFNPHKKTPCYVTVDSVPVIENAYFQLTNVVLDLSNNIAEYKGTIYANNFDFFKSMGTKTIDELNWSGVTFSANKTTIQHSWTAGTTNGVVFPMIDRGYGWQMGGTSLTTRVEHFKPCLYEKYLVDLIFEEAGFTYQSDFLNSSYFSNFIIDGLSVTRKKVDYSIILDYGLVYASFADAYCIYEVQLVKLSPSGVETIIHSETEDWEPSMGSWRYREWYGTADVDSGDKLYIRFLFFDFFKMAYWEAPFGPGASFTLDYQNTNTGDMQVELNSNYQFSLNSSPPLTHYMTFDVIVSDPDNTWNGTNDHTVPAFTGAKNVKTNIKQSDYITWLINRFNLYIDVDKTIPNKLIIEPRADFYNSNTGGTKDWTYKLDVSKPIDVKLISELQDKQLLFTYREDNNDKLNQTYKTDEKEIYGQELINFNNDFLTSQKKIEIGFSPSPLQNVPGSTEIIVPAIYPVDEGNTDFNYNIRSLYWGGLLPLATNDFYIYYTGGTFQQYFSQPYAGELDNPIYPSLSIMFGTPKQVYFNNNNPFSPYPGADLYSTYWRDWIEQISNKNSKLITAFINLSPTDIQQFKFSDRIHLLNQDFIVNKITYPALGGISKVELLKIEPTTPEVTDDKGKEFRIGRAVNGKGIGRDNSFFNQALIVGNENTVKPTDNAFIIGDDNIITRSHNAIIFGDNNTISSNTDKAFIAGDYNLIKSASTGSMILGGSGNTIDKNTNNILLLNVNNYSATTDVNNFTITSRLQAQSFTANTVYTPAIENLQTINGTPLSAFGDYLPISGGTVVGDAEFQKHFYTAGGYRINTQLCKLVNYTATTTDYMITVDTSAALTVFLPQAPPRGTYYIISDMNGNAATNPITVQPIYTGDTIQFTTGYTMGTNFQAIHLVYYDLTSDYQIVSSR